MDRVIAKTVSNSGDVQRAVSGRSVVRWWDATAREHCTGVLINWFYDQPVAVRRGKAWVLPVNDTTTIEGLSVGDWLSGQSV